ncbi:hypothetical protein Vretimale_16648 [Volvox reticuliferus]|uniref:Uncharacterized protein n=1 Tax=Volvox reticuliferus TaxID=1737510 RepID=A0A8J4FYR7_9CHLO|nr:hypothetical protein Vretifemale_17457 [Volvox reticuliferus]GIM13561.1 hypothetical protein Vretimale_16648 [Volvox reticuliferus]
MLLQAQKPLWCSRERPCSPRLAHKNRHLVIVNFKPSSPTSQTSSSVGNNANYAEDIFQKSIDIMLNRAASSLKRGTCTCMSCRGSGKVECAHCKGSGRLSIQAAERAGLLRGALLRLRTAVGLPPQEVPYASSGWMRTNRCPRCHGVGLLACEPCTGSGQRFPHQPGRTQ